MHHPNPYAPGKHILLDFSGAQHLDNVEIIDIALRNAAQRCGATLLHLHLHHFGEASGVTGVALLAESHISIHTWPELGFAALDIFMCGTCDASLAIPPLEAALKPTSIQKTEMTRGASILS